MQTMNISLPDQMKEFVECQVASGRYSSASEYVRALIRIDEQLRTRESLEGLLIEGLRSGESSEFTRNDFEEIRREAFEMLQRRASNR